MLLQGGNDSELSPRSVWFLAAAFFALGLIQILNHALWQDEWQAWLIARDSRSLADLFHNLRYEGHPGLWYLALFGLSRLTAQPLAMQLLHLGLATATVCLFMRFSPFTRLQKILFVFGYFPFFEYAVISRNYTAGILLIFLFCAIFPKTFPKKYLVLSGLLFLLCQTSIYGLLVALALGPALIIGQLLESPPNLPRPKLALAGAAIIFFAGIFLALLQLMPPPDSGFAVGWRFNLDWPVIVRTVSVIWDSYVPIPSLQLQFWNTNLIGQPFWKFFLSILVLGFSLLSFWRQPAVLGLFALGTLALLSFTYTKYLGSLRHHGHLFILLLAAAWLAGSGPGEGLTSDNRFAGFCRRHRSGFISALLWCQLAAGLLAAGLSLFYPFSAGRETARFIQDQGLDGLLLAGDEDDAASVISGYLRRPVYCLCARRWGTFVIWDQRRKGLEVPEAVERARELAAKYRKDVLLVLNREVKTPEPGVFPVRQFKRSMVPAEIYYLYRLTYPGAHQAP